MEDEWLRNTVALDVVVEDGFEKWPWDDLPWFVHHFGPTRERERVCMWVCGFMDTPESRENVQSKPSEGLSV